MSRSRSLRTAVVGIAVAALALTGCASGIPDPGASDADPAGGEWVTEGKFTVATGEPAYYPWVIDDDPESGEGFEAAVAYAVAEELGFAATPLPTDSWELRRMIQTAAEEIIGTSLSTAEEAVHLPEFDPGHGMSAGAVHPSWWKNTGIRILIDRFEGTLPPPVGG